MQVLVVDDEIAIVDLVADVLIEEGYTVTTAYDGLGARQLLRGGLRPDVIITDVMMPGLDGWELYKVIRHELGQQIGVIVMSAGKQIDLTDPRTRFMPKPFGVADLLDRLDDLL